MANTRNYQNQGGSTWVIGGDLNIVSSGNVTVSSGGQVTMPVTKSTETDEAIPNYGFCIIKSSEADADCRLVDAPTRAGLLLMLSAVTGTTVGVNVCVASVSSNVDITIESSGVSKPVWETSGGNTVTLVSANTSQWVVIGPIVGTLSSDGST